MPKVIYEKDGRIGRITLNRPDVLNAINDELPRASPMRRARQCRPGVHVIVLSGRPGLLRRLRPTAYAQTAGANNITQDMPWDPMKDYAFMMRNTECVHEPVAFLSAGDLQSARLRGRRRFRHRAVRAISS